MNVRKAIKKIVALGAGLTMIGATILGATADLGDYPAPFIQNGVYSGKIVVGAAAATSDVLGAIDIAA
ncbi:MAG: S-layer protein, partial [archaeon]